MKDFLLTLAGIGQMIGTWLGIYTPQPEQVTPAPQGEVRFGAVNFVGTLPTTLSGSGITSSATSIGVVSMTLQQTGQALSMSDFGTIGYITLEPGVSSRQEFASFTGITQNSNGSAVLTGVTRGLAPVSPYTASSTFRFSHSGGTKLIVSNSPPFYDTFANKQNAASITGQYTFASTAIPQMATNTTSAQLVANGTSTLATLEYVNTVAVSGAANATEAVKGISELGTAAEMASSTIFGSTGASTVIQTKNATDTPQSKCNSAGSANGAGCVPVTQLDGKISPQFIATSSAYTYNWGATSTFTNLVVQSASSTGFLKYFGDGSDGTVTASAGTTTLTRDMYYANLTIPAGATVTPAGYKIFVSGTLTVTGGFSRDGVNGGNGGAGGGAGSGGNGGTAGTATSSGSVYGWGLAGAGGVGANGSNGGGGCPATASGGASPNESNTLYSSILSGAGGTGGAGEQGGAGSAGALGSAWSASTSLRNYTSLLEMFDQNGLFHIGVAGSGGGGGGCSTVNNGSGGGGGGGGTQGGLLYIFAKNIVISSTGAISAKGGKGGNGGSGGAVNGGGGAGGGGGSGGLIIFIYQTLVNSGTISVAGGTFGTGAVGNGGGGTGSNGNAGSTGTIFYF